MKNDIIFIDLDDTLVPNAYAYHVPTMEACTLICLDLMWDAPSSPMNIMARAIEMQIHMIKKIGRITKDCFPLSYVETYKELCQNVNRTPNPKIMGAIIHACAKYFLQTYTLYPGVISALNSIQQRTVLLTRGDYEVQSYKIENTKLASYFSNIEIVNLKVPKTYEEMALKYHVAPENCIMIGDSFNNDIKPAIDSGWNAIQVCKNTDDWETSHKLDGNPFDSDAPDSQKGYAQGYPDKFKMVQTFPEVLNYL